MTSDQRSSYCGSYDASIAGIAVKNARMTLSCQKSLIKVRDPADREPLFVPQSRALLRAVQGGREESRVCAHAAQWMRTSGISCMS